MRRRYFVTYDISDDKRRTLVFKQLMGYGDHVQYSVFLCDLSDVELQRLKGVLIQHINMKDDQIIILNLGPAENDLDAKLECLGRSYSVPSRVLVV